MVSAVVAQVPVPAVAEAALPQVLVLADLAQVPDLAQLRDLAVEARLPVLAHLVVEVLVDLFSRQSFSAAMARSTT